MKNQKPRQVIKKIKKGSGSPELPINTAESNSRGDQLSTALSYALMALSVGALVGGCYWSSVQFLASFAGGHLAWQNMIWATLTLSMTFIISRSLFWLSFFGTSMLAMRMGAWKTLETVARRAIKYHRFIPNGSAWASMLLVQSLLGRGQYKDAITTAEDEWQRTGEDKGQAQNIGPMCTAVAMAYQAEGEYKTTVTWNDRAIAKLNGVLEEVSKPKKGLFAKATAPQSQQFTGQVKMQLAAAYFNNATIYFNMQDFRRAKENYKKAIENAKDTPDFPNKSDMIKMSSDQLGRLKHT